MVEKRRVAQAVFQAPFATADFQTGKRLFMDPAEEENSRRIPEQSRHIAATLAFATLVNDRQSIRERAR